MNYHVTISVFQSEEKESYPTEQDPLASDYAPQADASGYAPVSDAPGCAPKAGAPGYTALPDGMACDPQEGAHGNTQQATVIVTQPRVKATQEHPVPPSNLGLSIFTCLCCCSILGKLKFGLI